MCGSSLMPFGRIDNPMPNELPEPTFLFAVCQRGVEWALKDEVAARWPQLHFAFSRPGFVTFKQTGEKTASNSNPLIGSVYARTCGRTIGQAKGDSLAERAEQFWATAGSEPYDHLHIWQRDAALPGDHGFWPGPAALANEIGAQLLSFDSDKEVPVNELARPNQRVLSCIMVEPDHWWVGLHRVESVPQRWPGGVPKLTPPDEMISRAYVKTAEALAWSRLPANPGDAFVEIGCSPGGSVQALLDRGYTVTGIDPAEVDERLRNREGFTHIRKRGADLRRREYKAFRWLTADLNVAPSYTLETVENIVTYPGVKIDGMLLTLKLLDRPLYALAGDFVGRVRSWGYEEVRIRQLALGRQEICLAALRSKALRRKKT